MRFEYTPLTDNPFNNLPAHPTGICSCTLSPLAYFCVCGLSAGSPQDNFNLPVGCSSPFHQGCSIRWIEILIKQTSKVLICLNHAITLLPHGPVCTLTQGNVALVMIHLNSVSLIHATKGLSSQQQCLYVSMWPREVFVTSMFPRTRLFT